MRGGLRSRVLATVAVAAVGVLAVGCASGTGGSGANPASSTAPPAIALTSAGMQANPAAPATVQATGGELSAVRMTNTASGTEVRGALTPDRHGWHSTEQLGYGSTYRLDAVARASSGGAQSSRTFTLNTLTPKGQVETQLTPAPDSVAGPGVGVGQPIVVQFTKSVSDRAAAQAHLHVTSTPAQPGAWFWMDDQHVHYRPAQYWAPGTTINVDAQIYGADLGDGIYGSADRHATYRVHDSWIAKADGNTDQMAIFQNGRLVNTMPISMGKGSTPTHQGIHVVSDKDQTVQMDSCSFGLCSGPEAYNVTEHWAERISNGGEFVHQNPDSVSAQGSTNVSHGCINLNQTNAQWFFQHFGLGDVVEVSNSGGPPLPIWDTYGDWSLSWPQWQSGKAPGA